jgi:hypothetical protein
MLRSSVMALAALLLAAALAPAQAGGYFGGGWYGRWDFYGGRFVIPTHTVLHEYTASQLRLSASRGADAAWAAVATGSSLLLGRRRQ